MRRIRRLRTGSVAACVLAIVTALACGPAASPTQTPEVPGSTPVPATAAPETPESPVADSRLVKLLETMPLSVMERGIWFGDNERALELADSPHPKSVDEIRALSEAEREQYLDALSSVVHVADFGRSTGQAQEWKETFGINHFAIARGARTLTGVCMG